MARVLITDDSATARMIVQRCVEMLGWKNCEFHHAADGMAAFEALQRDVFDLVITDIVMPVMNGKDLLKKIRSVSLLNRMPVFVISSLVNPALEDELVKMGANWVIFKPVSPPKMLEAIESVIGKDFREK